MLRLSRHFRGQPIDTPTFLFRQHRGVRGHRGAEFASDARSRQWRNYNKMIFRGIYQALELHEYLPMREQSCALSRAETRTALLQRMCIMARHHLWPEMLADLRAATQGVLSAVPLSPAERHMCERALAPMFDTEHTTAAILQTRELPKRITVACSGPLGQEICAVFRKPLADYIRSLITEKKYCAALGAYWHMMPLFGLANLRTTLIALPQRRPRSLFP